MNEKDRDKLRIKRSAEQEKTFHYSREERLSMPGAPKLDYVKKGILRNNRALLILFLDLVIILILIYVFFRFFYETSYTASVGNYQLSLKGFLYEGKAYAALYVKMGRGKKAKSEREESTGNFVVKFYLKGREGKAVTVSGRLPVTTGDEIIVRQSLPFSGRETILYASVKIGAERKVLYRKLSK